MEIYLTIITTVLVLTQVIRTNKVIKAQLGQIEAVGDSEVKRRMEVDSLLIELLPALIARYVDGEDDDEC